MKARVSGFCWAAAARHAQTLSVKKRTTRAMERWRISGVSVRRGFGGRFATVEFAVEEIGGGVISREPVFVQKEVVDFIREDELFDFDVAGAEARDEIDGLREVNVAVVVAVNEERGRFPSVDGSDGRRVVREFR